MLEELELLAGFSEDSCVSGKMCSVRSPGFSLQARSSVRSLGCSRTSPHVSARLLRSISLDLLERLRLSGPEQVTKATRTLHVEACICSL